MAALAGVTIGWARGGRLEALGRASLSGLPLLIAAVALVLAARVPSMPAAAARVLQGSGYLAALAVLWQNRARPWTLLILLGLALNTLALALNGGRMPISADAFGRLTHVVHPEAAPLGLDARHVMVGPGTRLAPLGDVLPIAAGAVGVVLSPGDLLMGLGLAGFVQAEMRARGRPEA